MKFFVVFCISVILADAEIDEEFLKQTRARVRSVAEECIKEENAAMNDLDIIMNMKIPDSHEGKCLLFCIHKKFNFQNADGSINKEGALETFDVVKDVDATFYNKLVSAFSHCFSTPGDDDPCTYSAALSMCFLKKAKEEGIHEMIIE